MLFSYFFVGIEETFILDIFVELLFSSSLLLFLVEIVPSDSIGLQDQVEVDSSQQGSHSIGCEVDVVEVFDLLAHSPGREVEKIIFVLVVVEERAVVGEGEVAE